MHPQLQSIMGSSSYQVSAKGVLLGQVCSEVHLLPFEDLYQVLISREAELS